MSKHRSITLAGKPTPGPWGVITKEGYPGEFILLQRNVTEIDNDNPAPVEHTLANVRLIALAPEMAKALKDIRDNLSTVDIGLIRAVDDAEEIARAILAKLEG